VRIEQRQPLAIQEILTDQRFDQCRFARSGFPDNVHMRPPVGALDAKTPPVVAEVELGEHRYAVVGGSAHTARIIWRLYGG